MPLWMGLAWEVEGTREETILDTVDSLLPPGLQISSSFSFSDPSSSCFFSCLTIFSLFFHSFSSSSCPLNIVPRGGLSACVVLCVIFLQQTPSIFAKNKEEFQFPSALCLGDISINFRRCKPIAGLGIIFQGGFGAYYLTSVVSFCVKWK